MTQPFTTRLVRPSRRAFLYGAAGALVAARALAQDKPVFKVGTLPFGTVQWEIETMIRQGLDREAGLSVQNVPLASGEAARIAFLSGSVDAISNDLLFTARLKAEGKPVLYMPHSTTEGAVIVPAGSPIKAVSDLAGHSLGVAGGPLDKSWLVMRAAARKTDQLDLARAARPVFGAPPLLAAKVESGELDAALLYWTQAARLEAKGYRNLVSVSTLMRDLGAKPDVAIVGYVFHADADHDRLAAFGKAVHRTQAFLSTKPEAWAALRPMMKAPDDATFEALKAAYLQGIPHKPRAAEIADAQAFFDLIVQLGGADLVGSATSLPANLYVDQAIYG
jgi:NitT/TauT family transport system substrate-binding protein